MANLKGYGGSSRRKMVASDGWEVVGASSKPSAKTESKAFNPTITSAGSGHNQSISQTIKSCAGTGNSPSAVFDASYKGTKNSTGKKVSFVFSGATTKTGYISRTPTYKRPSSGASPSANLPFNGTYTVASGDVVSYNLTNDFYVYCNATIEYDYGNASCTAPSGPTPPAGKTFVEGKCTTSPKSGTTVAANGTFYSSGTTTTTYNFSAQYTGKIYPVYLYRPSALSNYVSNGAEEIRVNISNPDTQGKTIYKKYESGFYSDSSAKTEITSVEIPARNGYRFNGFWNETYGVIAVNTDGTIAASASSSAGINDGYVKGYVSYLRNRYTVTYNTNGGSWNGSAPANTTKYYDTGFTLPTNVTRVGYAFAGGNTKADGTGTNYTGTAVNLTSTDNDTVILYAKGTPITYKLQTKVGASDTSMGREYNGNGFDTVIETEIPAQNGYTFAGGDASVAPNANFDISTAQYSTNNSSGNSWSDKSTVVNAKYFKRLTTTQGATITLVAKGIANNYTATFKPNGGRGNDGTTGDKEFKYTIEDNFKNKYINSLVSLSMAGHDLNGMVSPSSSTNGDPKTYYTVSNLPGTGMYGNVTLTARGTAKTYTVHLYENGGNIRNTPEYIYEKFGTGFYSDSNANTEIEDNKISISTKKYSYDFCGYYYEVTFENKCIDDNGTIIASNRLLPNDGETIRLYAKGEGRPYTIVYMSNNGSGDTESQGRSYDDNVGLINNPFYKPGYVFKGWNTEANGTGLMYQPGDTNNLIGGNTAEDDNNFKADTTINLYAIGKSISYISIDDEKKGFVSGKLFINGEGKNIKAIRVRVNNKGVLFTGGYGDTIPSSEQ